MKNKVIVLFLSMLISSIATLFALTPYGEAFERAAGLPLLFKIRGPAQAPENIVIVAIDSRTGKELNLPSMPRDWPRSIHAELVRNLSDSGAKVIAFDIHFGREKEHSSDMELVSAVKEANNIVLVELLTGKRQPITDAQGKNVGMMWIEEVVPPFKALADEASAIATFPLPKQNAAVDQFWVFKESSDNSPTLPAVVFQMLIDMKYPDLTNQLLSLGQNDVEIHSFDNTQTNKPSNLSKLMGLVREISVNPDNKDKIEHLKNQASSKAQVAAIDMYTGSPNRFINFYGPPGTISTVPYHSVLKGYDPNIQTDSFNFANKIVFIGYSDLYDPGQPDRFYTVFTQDDGVDLSGVEIAATAFGNLVTNTSLRYLDTIITALFLLTFGLIIGLLLILFPAIVSVPIAIICSLIYLFLVQYQFNYNYTVYSLAIPLYLQAPLIIFIGLASQYILERKKGQRVIEAINYYLPEHIARDLAQNKLDEDKLNQVVYSVCMATDMAGFSKISEELPPDKLAIFLNSYFESLAAPLHKHGVNVTEFRADAIMCAWTSDTPSEEIRRKAILASIDAAIAINEFQKEHSILKAKLRIGLEVGHVYIGHAGGGGHFVYSIVGESANTASRVEGLNKVLGTQILATEGVLESIDNLLTRYLGDFIFVGKTEALPVYEIIALKENASHAQTDLCNSFNTALSLYHNRDWKNAAKYFNDILSKSSEDGPAKYYYDKCIEVLSVPESIDDPKVIKLNSK